MAERRPKVGEPEPSTASRGAQVVSPHAGPKPVENEREAALLMLLAIEAEAREAATLIDLYTLIANETPKLTRARQVFVFRQDSDQQKVVNVSSIARVDRGSPLLQWIEHTVARVAAEHGLNNLREFDLSAYAGPADASARTYPLRQAIWVPFNNRSGAICGGMLLTREIAWTERDTLIASRIAGAYGHAVISLVASEQKLARYLPGKRTWLIGLGVLAVLSLVPVSMTTLAPVEVVPLKPFFVASDIDGVIEDIPIEPNTPVKMGQVLVRFADTVLKNRLQLAEREVLVAEARLKTTTQVAFADVRGKHELAVTRAELALKTAERDYARDLLAKAEIKADRDGLAVFSNRNDLIGKPVSVGERLLQIADPDTIEFQLDVPVADSIILSEGARTKIFLDSSPLSSLEGKISRTEYLARVNDGVTLSFRVAASPESDTRPVPRLGARGTAQIYGAHVPVGFYLLRRPFTVFRQWTGL